jgi:uncharacterized membrane protein
MTNISKMKTNYLFKIRCFCLLFIVFIIACKHEPFEPTGTTGTTTTTTTTGTTTTTPVGLLTDATGWKCSADSVYFQYDVLPILNSACATSGCHNDLTKESGYQLTTYANTIKKGISAGKPNSSKIYTEMANGSMPPRGYPALTQAQKDIVSKWITQGAKNLSCNPSFGTCDTTNVKFATFISPLVVNKCQGCHTGTGAGAGIKLDSYATIKASVQTGKFWGSMAYLAGVSKMPKGTSQLPTCELNKIKAWIDRGALNN